MKKTTHLVILLLSSYYSYSLVGIDTTNPQNQLDLTNTKIGFSNYETSVDAETEVYLLSLRNDSDIIKTSFDDRNQHELQYRNPVSNSQLKTANNRVVLTRDKHKTKFQYYKNAGNYFVELILGTNLHSYFC
ncbi:hypothetical protein Q4Q34_11725 [Flavivirga abyssicola]|uniref:hypothetical protein n=1 Tax=Flavivirga abyssicola TaxID=3063533 RepID=UPI0026DEE5B7|nr:hypothetical protein [Flavivirga sp. MEBiC07777]WVK11895.1 hypothetical protein Q4Q34_11725 [Flavivirga sp. MEBiC07777]